MKFKLCLLKVSSGVFFRRITGKLNCVFARRLILACMSGSSVFQKFLHPEFGIHVEYSLGAKTLHYQYLLGWKSAARCCLKLRGFSYFILSLLAIKLHFFLSGWLQICPCNKLPVNVLDRNCLKQQFVKRDDSENAQTKQRF